MRLARSPDIIDTVIVENLCEGPAAAAHRHKVDLAVNLPEQLHQLLVDFSEIGSVDEQVLHHLQRSPWGRYDCHSRSGIIPCPPSARAGQWCRGGIATL